MNKFALITLLATFALAPASLAEEAHDHGDVGPEGKACVDGIEFIEAEIAKNPAAEMKSTLERKLRIAERELDEKEWSECEEAVAEAKAVVAGG